MGPRFRGGDEIKNGPVTWLLVGIVRLWQIGPSAILPPTCRYQPSCSAYAITALRRYGPLKGGWLAIKRIARCQPWGGHGPDPVP